MTPQKSPACLYVLWYNSAKNLVHLKEDGQPKNKYLSVSSNYTTLILKGKALQRIPLAREEAAFYTDNLLANTCRYLKNSIC